MKRFKDWILYWLGKKSRTKFTFSCSNEECGCSSSTYVYHEHDEDGWDVLQREVQAEFDKQQT